MVAKFQPRLLAAIPAAAVVLLFSSCASGGEDDSSTPFGAKTENSELQTLGGDLVAAYNSHDAARLASLACGEPAAKLNDSSLDIELEGLPTGTRLDNVEYDSFDTGNPSTVTEGDSAQLARELSIERSALVTMFADATGSEPGRAMVEFQAIKTDGQQWCVTSFEGGHAGKNGWGSATEPNNVARPTPPPASEPLTERAQYTYGGLGPIRAGLTYADIQKLGVTGPPRDGGESWGSCDIIKLDDGTKDTIVMKDGIVRGVEQNPNTATTRTTIGNIGLEDSKADVETLFADAVIAPQNLVFGGDQLLIHDPQYGSGYLRISFSDDQVTGFAAGDLEFLTYKVCTPVAA
ncbi:hypothetical protein [Rhodococcus erythropolis]